MKYVFMVSTVVCLIIIFSLSAKLKEANIRNLTLEKEILSNQKQIASVEGKLDVLLRVLGEKEK